MPNTIEAYRGGDHPFEYKQSNGFFTTVEMSSDDVKPAAHAAAMPSREIAAFCGVRTTQSATSP
jgi:hypothetical protein